MFFDFVGITSVQFKDYLSTGAQDEEIAAWIVQHAQPRERIETIRWNNHLRYKVTSYKRLSELPDRIQEFMEDFIPQFVPAHLPHHIDNIDYFFDIGLDEEKERVGEFLRARPTESLKDGGELPRIISHAPNDAVDFSAEATA